MTLRKYERGPRGNATVEVKKPYTGTNRLYAHQIALEYAYEDFVRKYERAPQWDIVMFRGAFTTFQVVMEIWEEEW